MAFKSIWVLTVGAVLAAMAPVRPIASSNERTIVNVTAERFSFFPSEIQISRGQSLELRIHSDDTTHGFHLKGTDIDVLVPKRGRGDVVVLFTPDRAGRYEFECSKLCGAGHHFMRGEIVVTDEPGGSPAGDGRD